MATSNMFAHFLEAVATGSSVEPYDATFYDGLRAAQVSEAAVASADTGRRIEVPRAVDAGTPRPL